jgi:hypothetical protein
MRWACPGAVGEKGLIMTAMFALVPFCYKNTVTGQMETILQGSSRDSVTSQAFLETPAAFWSATPLVGGTQTSPQLAAYMAAYPTT